MCVPVCGIYLSMYSCVSLCVVYTCICIHVKSLYSWEDQSFGTELGVVGFFFNYLGIIYSSRDLNGSEHCQDHLMVIRQETTQPTREESQSDIQRGMLGCNPWGSLLSPALPHTVSADLQNHKSSLPQALVFSAVKRLHWNRSRRAATWRADHLDVATFPHRHY